MDEMDDDFIRLAIKYEQERDAEVQRESARNLKAIGDALGVEIGVEDFTPPVREAFMGKVAEKVRQCGNGALADAYRSAWASRRQAWERFDQTMNDEQPTDLDRLTRARDGWHEAHGQFERVIADVSAWLREEGGA